MDFPVDEDLVDHLAVTLQGVSLAPPLPNASTSIKTLKQEFRQIANAKGWKRGGSQYRKEYAAFLGHEFSSLVGGTEMKVLLLQQLCVDFGCGSDPPSSITQCKKFLSGRFVNIYDYITCKRDGRPVGPIFGNKSRFQKYTLDGKVFPKAAAKRNQILKALLERIF